MAREELCKMIRLDELTFKLPPDAAR